MTFFTTKFCVSIGDMLFWRVGSTYQSSGLPNEKQWVGRPTHHTKRPPNIWVGPNEIVGGWVGGWLFYGNLHLVLSKIGRRVAALNLLLQISCCSQKILYVCIFMGKSHVALKDLVHCQCVFMVKSHVALKGLIRSQCVFYGQISCFRQKILYVPNVFIWASHLKVAIYTLNIVIFESGILGASSRDVNG